MNRAAEGDLPARFEETLRRTRLILPAETVLIALSGGLDSMTLLDLLERIRDPWRLALFAAHFNHRMRPGSQADAAWVREQCARRGIDLLERAARAPAHGETAARSQRYRFLRRAARSVGADRVATAHHADDVIETVLFRIARGTSTRGLAGIPPRRGRLVRPLLEFRRADLETHAAAVRVAHRDDPTNRDVAFRRNFIRHELLPALLRVAPGADEAVLRLAAHARADEAAWRSLLGAIADRVVQRPAEGGFELARPAFLSYHPQVQTRLLRRVFRALGATPDAAGTRAALAFISSCASGRRMRVAGGIELERSFDRLLVRTTTAPDVHARVAAGLTIGEPVDAAGTTAVGDRAFSARWWVRAEGVPDDGSPDAGMPGDVEAGEVHVALDLAALAFPLTLRAWRPGDRIARAYGTKKLAKLFAERRVGVERRRRTPVLADARGRVLWVAGVASAAGAEAVPGRPAFLLVVREC